MFNCKTLPIGGVLNSQENNERRDDNANLN